MRGHTDPLDCGMLFPPQTEVNVLIFVVLTISLRFSLHASYWTTWRTSWQQTDTKTFPGMKRKVYEDFLGWRRGESNPRPKILYSGPLRAFPVIWVSSPGTPAGKVPFGPSREKARPSAPREEASGYPVRVTSSRLYGHSTVGGRRLKPPELTDSRWRLLVSRFLRGAGPRHATHEHRHRRRSRFAPFRSPL